MSNVGGMGGGGNYLVFGAFFMLCNYYYYFKGEKWGVLFFFKFSKCFKTYFETIFLLKKTHFSPLK
jgi:hypothetical protein